MKRKHYFAVFLLLISLPAGACGSPKPEPQEPNAYLSITVTRRNNGFNAEDGLTSTVYVYDIAREELSEAGEFVYTAQYPLRVYSRGDNVLYYTADDGTSNDQLFCRDLTDGSTYRLTSNLCAVNYIIPAEEQVIAVAVSRRERNLTPYVFDKATNEVTRVQVYKDLTIKEYGFEPQTGRLLVSGFLEEENRREVTEFNEYLAENGLDLWDVPFTPSDSYIFELVDGYKCSEQRMFVEDHEIYGGILLDSEDRLFLQLSQSAPAAEIVPTTKTYQYDMAAEQLTETETFAELPLRVSRFEYFNGCFYILGSGAEGYEEEYERGIYRYNPADGEIKEIICNEWPATYINNFSLCWDYGDTGLNFTEDMRCEPPLPAAAGGAETPELLDQLQELQLVLPDEDGFVECPLIPEQMLPESTIYFTDADHYVIIEGGISLDTQEKLDTYRADRKKLAPDSIDRGIHVAPMERPEAGACILYAADGGISHVYEDIADKDFAWYFRDQNCEALAAGFCTRSPIVYYRTDSGAWLACRIPDWDGFSEEELAQMEILGIEVSRGTVTVTAFCGREIVRSIVPEQP